MATFIQSTGLQGVGVVDSIAKAYDNDVTAGNLLVAVCATFASDMPSAAVMDSQGNEWRMDVILQWDAVTTFATVAIFSVVAGGTGPNTVTLDVVGSDFQTIGLAEFSPTSGFIWAPAPERLDGFGSAIGSVAAASSVSFDVMTAGVGVVIGGLTHSESGPIAITPGTGWIEFFEDENTTERPISALYKLVTAGTHTPAWTFVPDTTHVCVGAGYKETSLTPDRNLRVDYGDYPPVGESE